MENEVQAAIRAEAGRLGIYLFRNNSGVLNDADGRPVRFGLGNDSQRLNKAMKSSDLIGFTATGRFVAVECKAPGWKGVRGEREIAQEKFINLVRQNGGIAGFVTCVADFHRLLQGL